MNGGNFSATSVRSWLVSGAGYTSSALFRRSGRRRSDEAESRYRPAARAVRNTTTTYGTRRKVLAGSAIGRWPNTALQRIAARWRLCPKLNSSVWAARAEGRR